MKPIILALMIAIPFHGFIFSSERDWRPVLFIASAAIATYKITNHFANKTIDAQQRLIDQQESEIEELKRVLHEAETKEKRTTALISNLKGIISEKEYVIGTLQVKLYKAESKKEKTTILSEQQNKKNMY